METGLVTSVSARRFHSPTVDSVAAGLAGVAAITDSLAELGEAPGAVFLKIDLGGERDGSGADIFSMTYPVLIAALARLFRAAGARVLVGDSPFVDGRPVQASWQNRGLDRLAGKEGFELVELEAEPIRAVPLEDTVYYIPQCILDSSLVVNVARLRGDSDFGVCGALTNLEGVLPGSHGRNRVRGRRRAERRARLLVDLYAIVQPGLTVVDVSEGCGAVEVLAGVDGVAVDCVMGQAQAMPVRVAAGAGLGIGWMEGIRMEGRSIGTGSIRYPGGYKERHWFGYDPVRRIAGGVVEIAEPWLWSRPRVLGETCDGCGDCVKSCPTNALGVKNGSGEPVVTGAFCIGCWRCTRMCERKALVPERSWLLRLLE